jgi:hypothetical protein
MALCRRAYVKARGTTVAAKAEEVLAELCAATGDDVRKFLGERLGVRPVGPRPPRDLQRERPPPPAWDGAPPSSGNGTFLGGPRDPGEGGDAERGPQRHVGPGADRELQRRAREQRNRHLGS